MGVKRILSTPFKLLPFKLLYIRAFHFKALCGNSIMQFRNIKYLTHFSPPLPRILTHIQPQHNAPAPRSKPFHSK